MNRFPGSARWLIPSLLLLPALGCEKKSDAPQAAPSPSASAVELPSTLFLAARPPDAKWVEEVKKTAKAGDAVTFRGRVGGSKDPFVEERAVLTLVGSGLKACNEDSPMPDCPTPWDFCCDPPSEILARSATIQVVDASGSPLRRSLKGSGGIKELSELTVVGKVRQADGKLLLVDATGVFVGGK